MPNLYSSSKSVRVDARRLRSTVQWWSVAGGIAVMIVGVVAFGVGIVGEHAPVGPERLAAAPEDHDVTDGTIRLQIPSFGAPATATSQGYSGNSLTFDASVPPPPATPESFGIQIRPQTKSSSSPSRFTDVRQPQQRDLDHSATSQHVSGPAVADMFSAGTPGTNGNPLKSKYLTFEPTAGSGAKGSTEAGSSLHLPTESLNGDGTGPAIRPRFVSNFPRPESTRGRRAASGTQPDYSAAAANSNAAKRITEAGTLPSDPKATREGARTSNVISVPNALRTSPAEEGKVRDGAEPFTGSTASRHSFIGMQNAEPTVPPAPVIIDGIPEPPKITIPGPTADSTSDSQPSPAPRNSVLQPQPQQEFPLEPQPDLNFGQQPLQSGTPEVQNPSQPPQPEFNFGPSPSDLHAPPSPQLLPEQPQLVEPKPKYGHSFGDVPAPVAEPIVTPLIPLDTIPRFAQPTPEQSVPQIIGGLVTESPAALPNANGHSIFQARPGTSGFRATVECDAPAWMSPYSARADVADSSGVISSVRSLPPLPPGYSPWWDVTVRQRTGTPEAAFPVDVGSLLQDAMVHSPQVVAIQTEPEVQYRVITQEAAKFDLTAFLESTYDDLNDPVGNTLTTADGRDRLITRKYRGSAGIRRRNLHGGEFRLAQEIGHENQSSTFFVPNNQGSSRLELSYRQPLLDGAGRCYNESEIVLARIQANSSEDEVVGALQDHLIEVTEAYWALYRARAEFFQRQKLMVSAQTVLKLLEGRSQVDTLPRQVLRARAAVARAQTSIQRTLARVEDAESQLRLLVNSPRLLNGTPIEVIPQEPPSMVTETADLQSVLNTALVNRPDISEAIRRMRASTVRLGVSRKELLPRLDFLIESYVADLSGNSDVQRALRGQFGDNRPGYTVGLEFEIPIENRAARAKYEQRQWELKRSINVFRATVEKSLTDTEIARREVATAYSEIISHYHSMKAAQQESNYLADRFTVLPASEDSATLLLEDLLDSFERMADEESGLVQAQVDHAIALVKLKQEMGVLLRSRHARPEIQSSQKEWMNGRLEAAVGTDADSSASDQHSGADKVEDTLDEDAPEDSEIRPASHSEITVPRPSPIPMAKHRTTWTRPAPRARQN